VPATPDDGRPDPVPVGVQAACRGCRVVVATERVARLSATRRTGLFPFTRLARQTVSSRQLSDTGARNLSASRSTCPNTRHHPCITPVDTVRRVCRTLSVQPLLGVSVWQDRGKMCVGFRGPERMVRLEVTVMRTAMEVGLTLLMAAVALVPGVSEGWRSSAVAFLTVGVLIKIAQARGVDLAGPRAPGWMVALGAGLLAVLSFVAIFGALAAAG